MANHVTSWRMVLKIKKYQCYRKQRHTVILVTCQRAGTMHRALKRYQYHVFDSFDSVAQL